MVQDKSLQRWDRDFRGVMGRRVGRRMDGCLGEGGLREGNGVGVGGRVMADLRSGPEV